MTLRYDDIIIVVAFSNISLLLIIVGNFDKK